MKQKAVIAELPLDLVTPTTQNSDRFVFSKMFNPLITQFHDTKDQMLTTYQKRVLEPFMTFSGGAIGESMKRFKRLLQKNRLRAKGKVRPADAEEREHAGDVEELIKSLKSEMGYLFLDRLRIRPTGFAIGEHVHTLSLAPGEEVVLEQKAFSKRMATYEEQTETERQTDLELASSLSTELQEGVERQQSKSLNTGFSVGGTVGGNIKGVDVSVNAGYTRDTTEANAMTRTQAVREAATTTSRMAARYRALHKVSFKVSTESGFESSSKRILRNPNKFTGVDVQFYKILRVLELTKERYGVRLCWSPWIKDPGFDLAERIRLGREAILKKAENVPLPPAPVAPSKSNKPALWTTGEMEADEWGLPQCDMRYDYTLAVDIPDGYIWDGDSGAVARSMTVTGNRPSNHYVMGTAWLQGRQVKLKVHVGVDWKWPGDAPKWTCGELKIAAGAKMIPDPSLPDPVYQSAYEAWLGQMKTYNDQVASIKKDAQDGAQKEAAAWQEAMLANLNPITELIGRFIAKNFPLESRNDNWEVDLWQSIFDWDAAGYSLYPSWWSEQGMRDKTLPPVDFSNASWGRMYLPVKVGMERAAMRWIFGREIEKALDAATEAEFSRIQKDLETFRTTHFGSADETVLSSAAAPELSEKIIVLGRWKDVLPTDGTHVETVQSMTSAADELSMNEIKDVNRSRDAAVSNQEEEASLKKILAEKLEKPGKIDLQINLDGMTSRTTG